MEAAEHELQCMFALPDVRPVVKPRPKPIREAPEATVEAIRCCYRERGMSALSEPRNRQRLAELSPRQRAELREWIAQKQTVPA